MADAVAQEARIPVTRVLDRRESSRTQVNLDITAAGAEKRPDEDPAHGDDAGEPARAGALQEAHEHRFGLVVCRMSGRHALRARASGNLTKGGIAGAAGLGLESFPGRLLPDRDPLEMEGDAEISAQAAGKGRVGIGLRTEPVVNMDGVQRHAKLGGEAAEHVEESDGVGAARQATKTTSPLWVIPERRMASRASALRSVPVVTFALEADPDLPVLEVLLLPDGHGLLERVDGEAAGLDGLAPVRRGDGDHDARLADLEPADPVQERHAAHSGPARPHG